MRPAKKLFLILALLIIAVMFLFTRELRKAFDITTETETRPIVSENTANTFLVDKSDYVLGNPGADLDIIIFGDFSCAKCREVYTTVSALVRSHPQDIRLVWKGAPIGGIFTRGNFLPHQAAYCAGRQNKSFEFMELLMADKHNLSEAGLKKAAEGLKLNENAWWQCSNSEEAKNKVTDSVSLFDALDLRTLPALFVNNKLLNTDADINLEEILLSFIKK